MRSFSSYICPTQLPFNTLRLSQNPNPAEETNRRAWIVVPDPGRYRDDRLFADRLPSPNPHCLMARIQNSASMKCDVAVVILTVCRESLLRAARSVYHQDYAGSIQLLIGVDVDLHGKKAELLALLEAEKPPRITLTVVDLGYSTSARYGGVHTCFYGGSLRSVLTLAANAQWVAYLDDDDWYLPAHLRLSLRAIQGKKWAFSLCWYADSNSSQPLCIDGLESVGVGKGVFAERFGGFVRPSALLVDKLALPQVTYLWSQALTKEGDGEDRLIFDALRKFPDPGETDTATVCYSLDPKDRMYERRREFMAQQGVQASVPAKIESVR